MRRQELRPNVNFWCDGNDNGLNRNATQSFPRCGISLWAFQSRSKKCDSALNVWLFVSTDSKTGDRTVGWFFLFFNGSEGAPCPNWSKRCWHNFQTVLCDSLIWPLLHLPWHPAVLILSAWAFYSVLKPEINFVAEPPNPLSTHIPLAQSSCLAALLTSVSELRVIWDVFF